MTLISSFASPSAGFVGISDVIVSSNAPLDSAENLPLPLRTKGVPHKPGERAIVALEQKSVIIDRTLLQWSGNLELAKIAIKTIRDISQDGSNPISQNEFIESCRFMENYLDQFSLIYHFNTEKGGILSWNWRCSTMENGDSKLIYRGSGAPTYFYNTSISAPQQIRGPEVVMSSALCRAAMQFVSEAKDNNRYNEFFGGWLEFIDKTESGFGKKPFAIKFWWKDKYNKIHTTEPHLFCWYVECDLYICRLDFSRIDEITKVSNKLFLVPDLLRRKSTAYPRKIFPDYAPYVTFHILCDDFDQRISSFGEFSYNNMGFNFKIDPVSGIDCDIEERFLSWLEGKVPDDSCVWKVTDDNDPTE